MSPSSASELWDKLCLVMVLCLNLHRYAVQVASWETARWLNLSSLSQKENHSITAHCYHGCLVDRLGSQTQRHGGKWLMKLTHAVSPYKLPGAAMLLALNHFLPLLRGEHVRTDNTTVVVNINKQGGYAHGVCLRPIVSSNSSLLSLRSIHVLGLMNHGADLMSILIQVIRRYGPGL